MISSFFKGALAYLKIIPSISKYGLWKYVFISGAFSLIVYSFFVWIFWAISDTMATWIVEYYPFERGKSVVEKTVNVGTFLSVLIGFSVVYKYVVLIMLSPLMGTVSEKIERYHHPSITFEQNIIGFGKNIIRGIRISLRNISKELFYTLILMVIGWVVPGAILITTPIIFILQAYYVGAGNFDYYLERHANVRESVRFTSNHKWLAIGNGTVFLALLFIPFLGPVVAPIFGAVSASVELDKIIHPA